MHDASISGETFSLNALTFCVCPEAFRNPVGGQTFRAKCTADLLYNQRDILDLRSILEARRPDIEHLCQTTALFSNTQYGGFTVYCIHVTCNPFVLFKKGQWVSTEERCILKLCTFLHVRNKTLHEDLCPSKTFPCWKNDSFTSDC